MNNNPPIAPVVAPEVVRAVVLPSANGNLTVGPDGQPVVAPASGNGAAGPGTVVAVTPTQVRRPWRSTVRSVFQFALALASLLPFIAAGVYTDADQAPVIVGQVLAVAATITRVMALPQVEEFLRRFLPFLSAVPRSDAP